MVLDIITRWTESQAREGKCGWVKDGGHTCFFPREAIPENPYGRMIIKFRQNGTLNSCREFNNVNWARFFGNFTHLLGYLQNQALKVLQKFELCKTSIIICILVDCQLLRAVLKISSLKQTIIQHPSQNSITSSSCSLLQNESRERFPFQYCLFFCLGSFIVRLSYIAQ